jgi:hypothetical protein
MDTHGCLHKRPPLDYARGGLSGVEGLRAAARWKLA